MTKVLMVLLAISCWPLPTQADGLAISSAKLLPNDSVVSLSAKVVTYASANFFYIEEDTRIAGIRVEKTGHGLTVGGRADIEGAMRTNPHNERYIAAASAVPSSPPDDTGSIAPVAMNNKAVGGSDWSYDSGAQGGQKGVSGGVGLNNIGLLIKVVGNVIQGGPGDADFPLADGSGVHVQVILPTGIAAPACGAYVAVTGVVSCIDEYQQIAGPSSPTYNHYQRRVVLARDWQAIVDPPAWRYSGEMIHIPSGSFLMGNSGVGKDATYISRGNELPQHSAYVSGYYIGEHEVTRGEYKQFMDAGGYSNSAYWSTAGWNWKGSRSQPDYWAAQQNWDWQVPPRPICDFTQTDAHPVVGVSYYEAEAFCKWAGGHLPTEAQWEKAARWAGYARVYPWGDAWDPAACRNSGSAPAYQTDPVGSYPAGASPYGLVDMAGNVWEWCTDWYSDNHYSQPPVGGWVDPQGPATATINSHIQRGGSWYWWQDLPDRDCRCAMRSGDLTYSQRSWVGFRLAR